VSSPIPISLVADLPHHRGDNTVVVTDEDAALLLLVRPRTSSGGWPAASACRKAAMAVGHSILVVAWHLLAYDCDDRDLGGDFFTRRGTDRAHRRAVAQVQALGYPVTLQPTTA
jgi:hypothetical protein